MAGAGAGSIEDIQYNGSSGKISYNPDRSTKVISGERITEESGMVKRQIH